MTTLILAEPRARYGVKPTPPKLSRVSPSVAHGTAEAVRLLDALRDEAALELGAAFEGCSAKKLDRACLPGCHRTGISRAINGYSRSNPLYRLVGFFLVLRRLGMSGDRAQRNINWLQEVKDDIWGPDEEEPRQVLGKKTELDAADDVPQQRLAWGEPGAAAELLEIVRRQQAHAPSVIQVLRRLAAE